MLLRTPLLAIAAALLAFAAWRDAAVEHWLYAAPGGAPALLRSDARVALAASDLAVLALDDEDEAFWRQAPDQARAALRANPLDAVAVRQLALAADALRQPGFVPGLLLADRISRRDVPTQIALLRLAAEANDYRRTFALLDTILTVEPPAGEQFFAPMATLLSDPAARAELARYGQRPWFTAFATGAIDKTANPADLAALLVVSKTSPPDAQAPLLPRLLSRLVDAGDYAAARDLALRFGKASPATLDSFGLSAATTDPRYAPLTWRLGASEAVQTGLTPDGALDVELRPGTAVPLAERTTALSPGSYVIEQQITRGDDGTSLLLEWELRCGADKTPVWKQPLSLPRQGGRFHARLEVPADCPLQRWRLTALADDAQSDASFRLAALRIGRVS